MPTVPAATSPRSSVTTTCACRSSARSRSNREAHERRAGGALFDLLVDCMEEGAFGVSLSFVDSDSEGRRVPSRLAGSEERSDLTATLERIGRGVVQYVPRFMRTDGYLKDIDRVDSTCRAHGIPQTFAPLPAQRRDRETTDAVMWRIRARCAAKARTVWPQVSPAGRARHPGGLRWVGPAIRRYAGVGGNEPSGR